MRTNAQDDWLAIQASVAADRLKSVPPELLGPAGRTLQKAAASGRFSLHDLTSVPATRVNQRSVPTNRSSLVRPTRSEGAVQPPLMFGVENPKD